MKRFAFAVLATAFAAVSVQADEGHNHKSAPAAASQHGGATGGHGGHGAAAAQHGSPLIVGEVRKVDKDAKKITIRHEAMPELDMPAMTMVFQVKDPAMLEQVKAGDKVRFQADKSTGAFVLVRLEPVK